MRDNGGPSGKKKGKAVAGKRLGAALEKLAVREGARGGAEDDDAGVGGEGPVSLAGAAEAEVQDAPSNEGGARKKRKAGKKAAEVVEGDEFGTAEDDEDDEAYEEPKKKKKVRKTRKG
jgi:DNA excision repair protein ERCC-5